MPALKMIAKLSKTCKREGGFPHVSPKSNKISKMSCSLVRVTHDPADLVTSTQTFQDVSSKNGAISEEHKNDENWMSCHGHETMLETCLSQDADSDSIEKTDVLPSCLSSSLGIMFSSSTVSSEANCNPVGAVQREQNAIAPQVDDDDYGHRSNNNSVFQTSNVLDSSVYEMCLAGFSTDRISASDYVNYDIFSDHELHGTNMIYDAAEGFPFFPFPEETIDAVDSLYGGSCEEFQQMSDYSWFHSVCQQTMPFNQEVDDDPFHFNSREVDYSDPEAFIRNFPELSDDSDSLPALVSKETSKRKHVTLVLDLDETLVHSTLEPCNGADFTIQVFFNKKEHTVYVRQRPFLKSFLERVSQMFEIIIFTASQSIYAEKVLDILDPNWELFSRRVFRESCMYLDGSYTKDLTVLGIDLAKVVIIDNSPQVFRLQVHNGIPIKSWFDDPSDNALNSLLPFLETLVDVDDVRPIIAKKFGVNS